jgi:hypothetical protein
MIEYRTDFYRLGSGILTTVKAYLKTLRQTGRTTQFIKSLRDGDIIVVSNETQKRIIRELALDSGINKIDFIIYNVNNTDIFADPLEELRSSLRGRNDRRIVFDHTWIEQYYIHSIHKMQKRLVHLGESYRLDTQSSFAYYID